MYWRRVLAYFAPLPSFVHENPYQKKSSPEQGYTNTNTLRKREGTKSTLGFRFFSTRAHPPAHRALHPLDNHAADDGDGMEVMPAREPADAVLRNAFHEAGALRQVFDVHLVKILHRDRAAGVLARAQRLHGA